MDLSSCIARLRANGAVIVALARQMDGDASRWSPGPEAWSALEVINHLADEEAEDFRTRVRITLSASQDPFPPIDPQGWVTSRDYAGRRMDASVQRFAFERAASLGWLLGLGAVDLSAVQAHPVFGSIRAGDLLAAWVDHDLLHMRQLVELQHGWWARVVPPFEAGYAGDW